MNRKHYIAGLLLPLFLYSAYSFKPVDRSGKEVYDKYCVKCHGEDGKRGKHKAKDLQYSRIADSSIVKIVTNGKKVMPAYSKKLTDGEIKAVVKHTKQLRKY